MHTLDLSSPALHDDAPGFARIGVIAVRLEHDRHPQHGRGELGPLGRSEDHRPVVDDEVDRVDVGMSGDAYGEATDVGRTQQRQALVCSSTRTPERLVTVML